MREKLQLKNISDIRQLSARQIIDVRFESGLSATRHCAESRTVKEFVAGLTRAADNETPYDVMLVEDYYQEAFLYLAELVGCPVVALNPRSAPQLSSHYFLGLGELNVYSFHDLHDPTMMDNSLAVYANKRYAEYLQQQEAVIKQLFQLTPETNIDFPHLHQRVVYILSNAYNYFNPPSPIVSGKEIKIGGFYIRPPKDLPKDIADFLHDANYGAIFVTLPSQVYGVAMEMDNVINRLMSAFSAMKQKVLFEWDGPKIPDQPKNVLVRRWIPQSDILAHPYVQLMICAGDIADIQSSIQRMVPLIGIPVTREQDLLLSQMVAAQIGQTILLHEVTTERVLNVTKEMFANQMLAQQLHYVSTFYRDVRPMGAMEEAALWVQFAGKHQRESRLYRPPVFHASNVIPPYYTRLITVVGGISVLAVVMLLLGALFVYRRVYGKGSKAIKKAV